ncbi:MAG: glycosyltransferase family 2 protein [Bacteroidota bacterium]|nr:glycosyltransferase family 2 protein [Bacteroidota bacterium]
MIKNKTIAVVVPAYNEEKQIEMVIETMPDFVDRIVIVNDKSKDKTAEIVKQAINKDKHNYSNSRIRPLKPERNRYNEADVLITEMAEREKVYFTSHEIFNETSDSDRIILINHLDNGGVGAAIATGYKWCKDMQIDCTAVMAGDGQMDPSELESICMPVVDESVDYVKGNRLIHQSARNVMPKRRFFGNSVLSILTKIASGYWRVSDTQTGYTAISLEALNSIELYKIYPKYGMPNDMLVKLNIVSCTVREIPIKPVYRIGEQSKMKIRKVIPKISYLLLRSFFKRLWQKYLIKSFHPLFLLYIIAFLLFIVSIPFAVKIINYAIFLRISVNPVTVLAFIFLFISSFQSLLFAMWMDIQDNERLYK